jgi:NADH:ubiquinone oxidoreductase subunit 5 (subunit L)/multisubunit Na+/H+ antiporter MnhA subunit
VAALAISGIPPLNGFVSKWMVYHGLVEMGEQSSFIWIIGLVAAMFGSALTLASFVKVLHSVFLGQPTAEKGAGPKPGFLMVLPVVVLALLCVAFGVFAYAVPVRGLLLPALGPRFAATFADATWQPWLATVLLLTALAGGVVIYALGAMGAVREDEAYVGGERAPLGAFHFSGVEFYRTVSRLPTLEDLYKYAEARWYDLYDLGQRFVGWVGVPLKAFHSGVLLTYVAWCVLGLVALLWFFLRFNLGQ